MPRKVLKKSALVARAKTSAAQKMVRLGAIPTEVQLSHIDHTAALLQESEDQVNGSLDSFMKRARFDADLDLYCKTVKNLTWQQVARESVDANNYDSLTLIICDYILHRLKQAQGYAGVGRPIVATLLEWAQLFLWSCIQEFKFERDLLRRLISGPCDASPSGRSRAS